MELLGEFLVQMAKAGVRRSKPYRMCGMDLDDWERLVEWVHYE